jgi:hypothetical protein
MFNLLQVEKYRYFDPETVGLDFEGMLDDIRNAPEGSIILLHGRVVTFDCRELCAVVGCHRHCPTSMQAVSC